MENTSVCQDYVVIIRVKDTVRSIFEKFKNKNNDYFQNTDSTIIKDLADLILINGQGGPTPDSSKPKTIVCVALLYNNTKNVNTIQELRLALCSLEEGKGGQEGKCYFRNNNPGEWLDPSKPSPAYENIKTLLSFFVKDSSSEDFVSCIHSHSLFVNLWSLLECESKEEVDRHTTGQNSETLIGENLDPLPKGQTQTQRDYNRIVQSRAFRRMVDKAQIYGAEQGVLYRTRMTHTQIVVRVARAMARKLNGQNGAQIDEQLTEVIALAHDLGHTPFGHQGERTLAVKLNERCRGLAGGFKHNAQSVRVMCLLEEDYPGFTGLNVSWKVLEGALYHTGLKDKAVKENVKFFQLDPLYQSNKEWFDHHLYLEDLHLKKKEDIHPHTLEAWVVNRADEIAQRSHDIDDGIMSEQIKCESLVDGLKRFGFQEYAKAMEEALKAVDVKQQQGWQYVNVLDVRRAVLAEKVIDLLIEGATIKGDSVDFTPECEAFMKHLERLVNRHVLSSQTVATFDQNASSIIGKMFDRLVDHPDLLPPEALRRFFVMQLKAHLPGVIDFSSCDFDARRDEMENIAEAGADLQRLTKDKKDPQLEELWNELVRQARGEYRFTKANAKLKTSGIKKQLASGYLLKWIYLNRVVADYISDMTDSMAKAEYQRICQYC